MPPDRQRATQAEYQRDQLLQAITFHELATEKKVSKAAWSKANTVLYAEALAIKREIRQPEPEDES